MQITCVGLQNQLLANLKIPVFHLKNGISQYLSVESGSEYLFFVQLFATFKTISLMSLCFRLGRFLVFPWGGSYVETNQYIGPKLEYARKHIVLYCPTMLDKSQAQSHWIEVIANIRCLPHGLLGTW